MRPILLPPPIRKTKRCERCTLSYPAKKENCPHCHGIDDLDLADLKLRHERQVKAAKNLGKLFAFFAVLILIALVLINF